MKEYKTGDLQRRGKDVLDNAKQEGSVRIVRGNEVYVLTYVQDPDEASDEPGAVVPRDSAGQPGVMDEMLKVQREILEAVRGMRGTQIVSTPGADQGSTHETSTPEVTSQPSNEARMRAVRDRVTAQEQEPVEEPLERHVAAEVVEAASGGDDVRPITTARNSMSALMKADEATMEAEYQAIRARQRRAKAEDQALMDAQRGPGKAAEVARIDWIVSEGSDSPTVAPSS